MVEWWYSMSVFEQILATMGLVSTLLLVLQLIISLIGAASGGAGGDGGMDVDADVDFDVDVPDGDMDFGGDVPDMDADFGGVPDAQTDFSADGYSEAPVHDVSTGLRLFTMQGIIAFLAVFSWSALLMEKSGLNPVASLMIGAALGFIAMFLMALVMRAMLKLQYDGTSDIRNALGSVGTVYLTIPPKRSRTGKVTLILQGSLKEIDAISDEEEAIPTGSQVLVTGVSGKNILLVRKK